MDHQPTSAAPDAGNVLKFVASVAWRSKWLIGIAAIVVAAVAFALAPSNTIETWSGRAILRIGMAPASEYIVLKIGVPLATIEAQRDVVAQISDPAFRQRVATEAAFEPATAAASRSLVVSSLRGVVLDGDRDVGIELNAASSADVQAAFRTIAADIGKMHDAILDRRLEILQNRIENSKSRIAAIEKASSQLNDRIFNAVPDEGTTARASIFVPVPAAAVPSWSNLQDRIEEDTNLRKLAEPSVLHLESDNHVTGSRSVQTLRFSLLAGFGMLLAMIVLTVVFSRPVRASAD